MTTYDMPARELACGLFDRGLGYRVAAGELGIPADAVRQWLLTYHAVGKDALLEMGKTRAKYDYGTKVAAASTVVDGGMAKPEAMRRFGIASISPLKNWC